MENQNSQPISPAQESNATKNANISQTPPPANPQKKKFLFILIGFFIIFFLTLGATAAIYIFKEVSRSNNNELEQIPSITPRPSTEFEISPIPTSSSANSECVVGGCSGQLCVSKDEAEGLVTTCEWTEAYACYKTATCELQASGKCGWTQTPELTSCLESAK